MDKETKQIDPVGSDFNEHLEDELRDPEMAAYFINAAIAEHDAKYLKIALGKVVRIHGVSEVAKMANLNRESLYKMLSAEGNPGFENLIEILDVCGLEIAVHPKGQPSERPPVEQNTYVMKNDLNGIIRATISETLLEYIRQKKMKAPRHHAKVSRRPQGVEPSELKRLAKKATKKRQ